MNELCKEIIFNIFPLVPKDFGFLSLLVSTSFMYVSLKYQIDVYQDVKAR